MKLKFAIFGLFVLALFSWPLRSEEPYAVARADEEYKRRAEGHDGLFADPRPISRAVTAYAVALSADPNDLAIRAKLLRALFYLGEYATQKPDAKLSIFERGRKLGEEGITQMIGGTELDRRGAEHFDRLIGFLRDQPNSTDIYFWAAAHWGLWGRHRGRIAATRQGVAGKIRDYGAIVVALDPSYEAGGGHRLLGRLHAVAPRIPFITGWVSRKTALAELEKARSYSDDAVTTLYYVEALLRFESPRRPEALKLLRQLVHRSPDPGHIVEETRAIAAAQELLYKLAQ